ncbi:MAG: hypothetical protein AUJ92_15410 [Armatimonadetes bacterium CG2_30_59_28]|nr:TlpA family protein disulfide reductase [Armatimonadota bacterium]OIO91905.1 MAG: hypothetical protein AUJ92_15410 [Armatimonadetes bacterium CG2_30_59_28]PIU65486.1 MAG: hypothetical protein COS85_08570 [Armatimonadetes bacterium CG07_land_8_20_14_0_80_59_28]PIX44966.1 MAG: hypothetical protein COZ56_03115 [Armatimonadetes bacterium CG_4_8_14_3_um_filter_58_9]PIY37102.1 MAG: hypothetical protein COZ05_22935 [Armatimonadetes bacterium CG_4_10_14_3_um_filter_59_10]PJB72325.1 MAG: hypothetica
MRILLRATRWAVLSCVVLTAPANAALKEGTKLPSFSVKLIDGKTIIGNPELAGKVSLLNFWATWCVPCQEEVKHLQALHKKYYKQRVVVMGVSQDEEGAAMVKPFARQKGLTYKMGVDPEGKVATKLQGLPVPVLYIVDKKGAIRYTKKVFSAKDIPAIEEKIEALLKE